MAQPATNVWKDPQIEIGPFRILPRTDGRWVAFDTRGQLGEQSAAIEDTQEAAVAAAKALVARGAPLGVVATEPPTREQAAPRPKRAR